MGGTQGPGSGDAAPKRTSAGRERLLDAAEKLLDESGIDGTSGAAIVAAAGNRNAAAVNYHFGNLDGCILAVLRRRTDELDARRNRLIDDLEGEGPVSPRAALAAMVAPLVGLLDDPGGRRYVRLLNQAANHPRFHDAADWTFASSIARGAGYLEPLLAHLPAHRQHARAHNVLGFALYSLASRATAIDRPDSDAEFLTRDEFNDELLATIVAALGA